MACFRNRPGARNFCGQGGHGIRAPDNPTERMRSFLFALVILSADAALDASALDSSARTLAAATTFFCRIRSTAPLYQ